MLKRSPILAAALIPLLCLLAVGVYFLPPVHSRLDWRVRGLITQVRYALDPPGQDVFIPQEASGQDAQATAIAGLVDLALQEATRQAGAQATDQAPQPAGTEQTPVGQAPAGQASAASPTPSPEATALPPQAALSGFRHEYQEMNNCGPATLAMNLSFWGWQGDQTTTRASLRPNFERVDDKNVNPWEMVAYVGSQPGLKAVARVGGDLPLLKRLLAAGFPVIIEKGFQPPGEDWMGHFELLTAYDDARGAGGAGASGAFIAQDSYVGPDIPVAYADLETRWWRDFNYAYVVIYPEDREGEVLGLLGAHADPDENLRLAAEKARREFPLLQGRDQFFALFNLGSSLVGLGEYVGAAQAFDQAWGVYATLGEEDRPWRVLWYMDGPYAAYYYTGRYEDLLTLGNQTLNNAGGPLLEETFYWMGLAREATGDLEKAIYDYQKAVEINPASTPARQELARLGVQ